MIRIPIAIVSISRKDLEEGFKAGKYNSTKTILGYQECDNSILEPIVECIVSKMQKDGFFKHPERYINVDN